MNIREPIEYRHAKWLLVGFIALMLAMVVWLSTAYANVGITRSGLSYNGTRNPGNCEIADDNGELHVKCTSKVGASGPAFIRYRFLKDVGAIRDTATVSAAIKNWVGEPCFIEWMVKEPKTAARTARITVPEGSYCHVLSVSWSQI